MEKNKGNRKPQEPLRYLTGAPLDSQTLPAVVKLCLSTVALMFAFLLLGMMLMWKNDVLRVVVNAFLLFLAYFVYWQSGVGAGATAVNLGEILYQRQETGRDVDAGERRRSFHAAKGFLNGLIASIPIFLCALGLALTAEKVLSSAGTLPSWLESLETREEIGGALASYHVGASLSFPDVLRLLIRMAIMPYVNIVGAENKDGLLMLERVSPLLVLLPGLSYGVGYLSGVSVRSRVHADIEAGKRKMKNRQKRELQQRGKRRRPETDRGPGQLN